MAAEIIRLERQQGDVYRFERQVKNDEIQKKQEALRKKRADDKKGKVRYRIGKQPMFRSTKKSYKKKEIVKEIDPEKLAFLKYLGQLEEEETQTTAK